MYDISSVFISNKTVSVARKLRWSTIPASQRGGGGGGAIGLLPSSSSLGRLYSMIMVEAITLIQARTSWIFSGVLHL